MEMQDIYQEKMRLTKEQESCLEYQGDKTLMIKGYAGAGKSVVLLAYARKLQAGYEKGAKHKIGVFTFCNSLNTFTREILGLQEEEGPVTAVTLQAYIEKAYRTAGLPERKKCTDEERMKFMERALAIHKEKYGRHRFHDLDPKFWLEEISWMKDMNIGKEDRDVYLALPRTGRGGQVRMSAIDRITAFQIFLEYENVLCTEQKEEWVDHSLYLIRHPEKIPDSMKFDHVLMDEAQDLSFTQMKTATLFSRRSMVIAMDMNQRIFDKYWTPKMLGLDTCTKKLTRSMRCTGQIDALAESVRRKNDICLAEEDRSVHIMPETEGPLPQLVHLNTEEEEKKFVAGQIQAWREQEPKASVAVIVSKNEQRNKAALWLADYGIKSEILSKDSSFSLQSPGVKIISIHSAKGLEFRNVIIPWFVEGNFPYTYHPQDEEDQKHFLIKSRNLLYVAMTRARRSLVITYSGERGSRFIGEMDAECYRAKGRELPYHKEDELTEARVPELPPVIHAEEQKTEGEDLKGFFIRKGFEVEDQRDSQGFSWVIGRKKQIDTVIKEAGRLFGAYGRYSEGDKAINKRPGWFTRCKK